MRLGTFVMGGLAGAAICLMMQRSRSFSAITDGAGQMLKQRMNDVKENVMQKGIDLKFSNGFMGTSSGNNGKSRHKNNKRSAGGASHTEGLDQVEYIASQDPHVKQEVNEILQENEQQRI